MRRILTLLVLLCLGFPLRAQYAAINTATDIVRFVPSAAHITLGLTGVESSLSFGDRLIESAIAHTLSVGLGYAAKSVFHVERPDGSDFKSCPSGHAVIAFTGAELMRMDYGNLWGAGAYVLSAGVAAGRVYTKRHRVYDVLAGAGLGVLCAHAGKWLLQPVKLLFGLPEWTWDGFSKRGEIQVAFLPGADPLSGAPMAGLAVVF